MANLERILDDYKAIRQENAALAAKVREGWVTIRFAVLFLRGNKTRGRADLDGTEVWVSHWRDGCSLTPPAVPIGILLFLERQADYHFFVSWKLTDFSSGTCSWRVHALVGLGGSGWSSSGPLLFRCTTVHVSVRKGFHKISWLKSNLSLGIFNTGIIHHSEISDWFVDYIWTESDVWVAFECSPLMLSSPISKVLLYVRHQLK